MFLFEWTFHDETQGYARVALRLVENDVIIWIESHEDNIKENYIVSF